MSIKEVPDSNKLFSDVVFQRENAHIASEWQRITEVYPAGLNQPLLPEVFSREQFGQGNHYECFMISALATLVRFPDVIRNCFVTQKVRQDGRYTFQFFRGREWVRVEIDDTIPMEDGEVLYLRSPTEHWWPLLLEKAYAKFYTAYDHLEGCTLQETFHDLTGNPVLNIPMDAKLAKAAGAEVTEGFYWLDLAQRIHSGQFVASVLTKDIELETMGLQREQQYGILEIFSLTGTSSINDIVIRLHNPFEDEEYLYKGPLNSKDTTWDAKQRAKHDVDDERSIFLPLNTFLKIMNSVQLCYITTVASDATYFEDEWKGESAGGNPTSVSWRKNPLYFVCNSGSTALEVVVIIKQEDQRRFMSLTEMTKYLQCGMVLIHYSYANPIPTFWVTGNNHKPIHKSLFLNSREVANTMTIPPNSLCYLVPSCMHKGVDGPFSLALYRMKDVDYSDLTITKLAIPSMNWSSPATKNVELCQKEKDRVDFYVDEATDVHILLHQTKPYVSKSGGDAMTEDYMGMYLYDDTDRKVAGVHAATNFREISAIHRLPRSGRYAISITCPRAKSDVPAYITIIGSHASNVRIVDPPEDATMFDDEDIIDEGEDAALEHNPVDYTPVVFDAARHGEQVESDSPFEDKRFYMDNRGATSDPWVHIGDLYPEGKTVPLLPNELRRDQFGQGDHYDCSTLTAFAALLERHPDVIRNCFVSKNPRKDGRYTFQFHRYGQWVKVEIDDRIPMVKDDTVFCRSPTHHWWPLLLEKAYAKFYTLYENLEGISQEEVFHDYTGQPCLSVSTDPEAARVNMSYFDEVPYWMELASMLPNLSVTALASGQKAEAYGLLDGQYYALLEIISGKDTQRVSDVLVKMYNPYEDSPYIGPMNAEDSAWTSELQRRVRPERELHVFYIPAHHFVAAFSMVQMGYAGGLAEPSWHFNSEWAQGTNGGDTSFVSWRENPLYIFSNPTEDPVQIIGMVRQPDQRHLLHTLPNQELAYPKKGLAVAQANPSAAGIPTHLVTLDNHRFIHREMLLPVREVTNVLTIPPQSVCYVVGYCHSRVISKFLLSYWFMRDQDIAKLSIERYRPKVAKHQPAIAHVDLYNRAKERVDFLVDTPTEVHAVFKQEKVFHSPHGGDVLAEDYVGVYLYDLQNNRIKGIQSAMNYRELSLVAHLTEPGHYVFFSTCPRGNGDVPCRVEICAVEKAHVRITDPPEDAIAMSEPDMAFLDAFPEGIPLSELPIDSDPQFQDDVTELGRLLSDPSARAEEIEQLKNRMSKRVRELAKAHLARDRPIYLSGRDLSVLNPVVDNDEAYMNAERERYYLKQDLRNHYKLLQQEDELRGFADSAFERHICTDFSFIEARPEGIPRNDIPLASDKAFAEMMQERVGLRRRPKENASAIGEIEARMGERAREIARAMHDAERVYLNLQPAGVPLDLVPLNTDAQFGAMEDELRALLRSPITDHSAITALHDHLNEHAHNLAREVRRSERVRFLKSEDADRLLPILDNDPEFTAKEIQRLRALKEDPERNATSIENLENDLNERAAQLSNKLKQSDRAFLIPYGVELDLISDTLDGNSRFRQKENHLRELRENPQHNSSDIETLQNDMAREALLLTTQYKSQQRPTYLEAEYEGRPMETLPLDDDAAFRDAETAYLGMCESGNADPAALQRLVGAMRERATDIARGMNAADRPKYLPKAVRGVPLRALGLDDDEEFRHVEQERARAVCASGHEAEAAALEARLLARAVELASLHLCGDRAFLDQNPEGIPLAALKLDDDDLFRAKEEQRASLLGDGLTEANRFAIAVFEESMNQQVHDMAKRLKALLIGQHVPEQVRGIPREVIPLLADERSSEIIAELTLCASGPALVKQVALLKARAEELVDASIEGIRSRLDVAPVHVQLSYLPLDEDESFKTLEIEALVEVQKPKPDAATVQDLIGALNCRARELAEQLCWEERKALMDSNPEGRALRSLPLNTDTIFLSAEAKHRAEAKVESSDVAALRVLMEEMAARAQQLALEANRKDRVSFVSAVVRGVALHDLPLDDDDAFRELERKRAMALQDPKQSAATVPAIEEALRSRADALATSVLRNDRTFLDSRPEGVPLRQVPIDSDRRFQQLEEQRAQLRTSFREAGADFSTEEVKAIERMMNERVHEMANGVKPLLRNQLAQTVLGISLKDLPLDTDAVFSETEERCRDAEAAGDDKAATALKSDLNARATTLAEAMHKAERAALWQVPEGVPLEALPLNSDDVFLDLEKEARLIRHIAAAVPSRHQRSSDVTKLAALIAELNRRACILANESRLAYCDAEPEGIPLETLQLASQPEFIGKEEERRHLVKTHGVDSDPVRSCNAELRKMAYTIARSRVQGDRGFLDSDPEGVPLSVLPLDEDAAFHSMEVERARLKAQNTSAAASKAKALEEKLNERVHDLARLQKEEDLRGIDPAPHGIPLAVLQPHSDGTFASMVDLLRALKLESPAANADKICGLQADMNGRCLALAKSRVADDRAFLDADPEGVPLVLLPLDMDAAFQELETQRANLKSLDPIRNAAAVKELEDRLNERAHELAMDHITQELDGLTPEPFDVPLEVLRPYEDPSFKQAVAALRQLHTTNKADPTVASIKAAMEERCQTMAHDLLEKDRGYLHDRPKNVSLSLLPLNSDEAFHAGEVRRALLKAENARRNADKITELEGQLNLRAMELAELRRTQDMVGLDAEPAGVPLRVIDPHADAAFAALVEKRRALEVEQPASKTPSPQLAQVVSAMNCRAHELAKGILEGDRRYLDQDPEGVPLEVLPFDTDKVFHAMEVERAAMKAADPKRNAGRIRELEEKLNDRAHELAQVQKDEELCGLDPTPRGISLKLLRPHEDPLFSELVKQMRVMKKNPPRDDQEMVRHLEEMNARAAALADKVMDRGYLDPNPEGVPLQELPLETDDKFRSMEMERARLKLTDPRGQSAMISSLESALNQRAEELAKRQCVADLASVEDAPLEVAKELLRLHSDAEGATLIEDLRQLRKNPGRNAGVLRQKEAALNDRAFEVARKLLVGDRANYIDPRPRNIPLEDLPLEKDEMFHALEVERVVLKLTDPIHNAAAVRNTESTLNDRAYQLAELVMKEDLAGFPPSYHGILTKDLNPHSDRIFSETAEKRRFRIRVPTVTFKEDLEQIMDDRLSELARERKDGELYFMNPSPEGVLLADLPLSTDTLFNNMCQERQQLKEKDAMENRKAVVTLEDEMNKRAAVLARSVLNSDFDGVDKAPLGIPLDLLRPRQNAEVARLIPELRRCKRAAQLKNKVAGLQAKMNECVRVLAAAALEEGREKYLDAHPEGVPLELLPLRTDDVFHDKEAQRATLRLQDPVKHAGAITQLESQLNAQAHKLALRQKEEDLVGVDLAPRGIPLAFLHPHEDAKMMGFIKDVRVLKTDPLHNKDNIRWQQQQMNERAHELATLALNGDREYLRPNPLGVSLTVLPLDEDPAFHEAEVARVVAKRQPHPNSKAIALLEQQLNARAEELAAAQLQCDVEGLEQAPLGVPLSLLKPHADSTFAELLPELRRLEKDPARNATKLKQLRAAANECNYELAEAFLAKDRSTYMGAEPEGVPLHLLKLTADDEFKALENKRLQLHSMQQAGRTVNAKDFSALDALLKERAHEVAKQLLRKDRGYLDPFPEGVALDILPLDSDPAFRRLETTRAAAKYRNTITQANDLEDQLNARARELALAQKEEDLRGLDQHPHDLPLTLLQPHQDAQFEQLVDELRRLKASHGDQRKAVKEVQDRLNNRSYAMADRVTKGDRRYLHPKPENVPLSRLPLGTDATFHALEIERAMLKLKEPRKNQHRIADMEDQLNSRAAELAKAVKMEDLKSLAQTPRGIPVELLKLHEDPKFSALIAEKEQLPKGRSGEVTATLLNSMNECALEVADKLLRGDRGYLNRELEGALLPCLPLDTDMAFHEMEVERAKLKVRDPVKNASVIDDLEDQLTKRAHELMSAVLVMDRDYLNPSPEGVPIEELLLDTDSKFHSMEVERAKLKVRDLQGNAARIKDLEGYLNDHAAGLAKQQLEEDLKGLDREPEGYPLKCLRPHSDAAFAAVVVSLRRAKMEPLGNVAKVHEAQATLNARAHELARERIAADRARLNQEPEKVPLALLPLEKDAQFAAVEKELRMLKAADKPNLKAITEVEGQMNDRAHVLARAYLKQSRDFLDQEPEGVALDYVPLDKDTHFCALERDRLCLLAKGASLSSAQVRAMEERLNDRAHELAAKVKTKGRDFLRSQSSDIPKELLALDADKVFVAKEKELRKHQQQLDGPHSLNTVANLRRELQQRADEVSEAQLKGDRGKYLDLQPEGVDLCDIPLDTDHIYHGMEVERAILLADDATGRKPTVAELEKKLNTRAHELAHQIIVSDRYYLPEEVYGIPVEELPLATDSKFNKLERQRRVHKRSSNMRKEVAADEEELRCHAQELAKEVIALDLEPIKASYRGIPKVELNLHADSAFRELAKKRRRLRGKGRVEATEMTAIEDEMDRRACEIADDVINNERAFLDPEPEGMYLIDVPLDDDQAFQQLEQEYRRRRRDPRTAKQNGSVLRELAEEMNQRSHTLARATFAKTRGFMKQEPEGIPLVELGLDEDPEFKEAEIARYRTNRSVVPNAATVAEMEVRMDGRARELARATLAADRAFLDPKPEGVSLEVLPLDSDMEFSDLARERRRRKKILKGGVGEAEVRAVEEKMNARSHEMAKEFLEMERAFLSREPEGVPLADLPLNADPLFRTMENERLRLKRDPLVNTAMLAAKEADLEHRAHVIAKDLLRKERAFLDPEPLSVPLEELPLNYDDVLNPVERKRRVLRMHPKRNHAAIRTCEEQMADRVGQIAVNFVDKERGFLDQNPEGVPLRYLPLNTDREFHEKELHRRKLRKRPEKNCGEIADTERKMNERVHALAKDLVLKGRAFLHPDPCGVPIADVPLNEDEYFRKMEEQRRALKEAGRSVASVKAIEEKLNDRAEKLAQRQLDEERSFMDRAPLGIPLHELPLNTDQRMREIERTRRQLRKSDSKSGAVDMSVLEAGMNARAHELADQLLSNDRGYLHPEPCGVPLADLPLHTDCIFHEAELARFRAKKNCQTDLLLMEKELNKRAMELAAEFIQKERAYLNQEPEGIPLERLPLDTDPTFHGMELERRRLKRSGENPPQVLELEDLLNRRVHELAMELRGWQDPEFHEVNEHVAEQWVRVCDLYPEGRYGAFIPTNPAPDDVFSAPQDVGYLVPFIAALSRHPVLLQRVIATEETPVNAPYTFIFFDPHSNPVYVDVDDRVPCTQAHEPKFVQSPCHLWWPLLLEKAYAKFVGGYERLNNCTSLETLRDLTGRPVTHTPFDMKLAEAASLGKYTSVDFWLGVAEDMARGDVVVCSSNAEVPDGIHPLCSYALIGVVVTVEGSTSPSDVVIKLENSYRNDEPFYTGPLCHRDANWSLMLQRVCQYDPERDDILYLPLPTFLRNFSSMQTCHINCGDRLTVTGTWDSRTSGGNSKFTSFRNNPIFVLQNSSSRPATVLSELRHATPEFVDPEGCSHYPQSGIVLMEPTSSSAPLTPLITNSTACFLQRGVMLDSREVCSLMEIPANSTCFLIPYTSKVGEHGSFFLSVYPGFAKVSLTPLHYCGLSREPKSVAVMLTPGAEGRRVDFTVSSACDVHVLVRQEKMTNRLAAMKGDAIAEDDVVMVAFNDQAMKLTSSGDATNAREHSLVFRADKPGYYSLLLTSPNQPVTGDNPCTVSIFTPKRVMVKFVPPPAGARPLRPTRFPVLPRGPATAAGGSNPRRLRGASTARQLQPQREATLPPLRKNGAGTPSAGFLSLSGPFSCSC